MWWVKIIVKSECKVVVKLLLFWIIVSFRYFTSRYEFTVVAVNSNMTSLCFCYSLVKLRINWRRFQRYHVYEHFCVYWEMLQLFVMMLLMLLRGHCDRRQLHYCKFLSDECLSANVPSALQRHLSGTLCQHHSVLNWDSLTLFKARLKTHLFSSLFG